MAIFEGPDANRNIIIIVAVVVVVAIIYYQLYNWSADRTSEAHSPESRRSRPLIESHRRADFLAAGFFGSPSYQTVTR